VFLKGYFINCYNTRATARKQLYQPRARLNITSKSLPTMGVKIWNCLPLSIRNLSKSSLKKKCKRMLQEILNTCDDYVDLAYIMQTASMVS
jgi:NADPH-dependent 7-cyano-7-deazaguanine reductase QueF-like protein